jgi:uncharacterized protein YjiS (DUF1127 family)
MIMSRTIHPSAAWLHDEHSAGLLNRLARSVGDFAALIAERHRRSVAIAELERLDDHMLKDIGLNRSEIAIAVRGQAPENRI